MSGFGFDYYVERLNILTEAAGRPDSQMLAIGPAGEKMLYYRKVVTDIMESGGTYTNDDGESVNVPGFPRGAGISNRVNRYIMSVIRDIENPVTPEKEEERHEQAQDKFNFEKETDDLIQLSKDILGYGRIPKSQIPGKPTSMDLYRMAIRKWTSDNQEKVMSNEFEKEITDKDTILRKLADPGFRKALHHRFGLGKIETRESGYQMSDEERHALIARIAPTLKLIHRNQGYKAAKNIKMTTATMQDVSDTGDDIQNNATENIKHFITIIQGALWMHNTVVKAVRESLPPGSDFYDMLVYNPKEHKTEIDDIIDKIKYANARLFHNECNFNELIALLYMYPGFPDAELLDDIVSSFDDLKDVGMTADDMKRELTVFKNNVADERVAPIIDYLIRNIEKHIQGQAEQSVQFPEYSSEILRKFLTTPELKRNFKEWYFKIYIPTKNMKIERAESKWLSMHWSASDEAKLQAFEKLRRDMAYWKGRIMHSPEEDLNEIELQIRNKYNEFASRNPSAANTYLNKALKAYASENPQPQAEEQQFGESYVMGYMSEQIQKDRFKPKGEFKDRGFRKVKNIAQWMLINQ